MNGERHSAGQFSLPGTGESHARQGMPRLPLAALALAAFLLTACGGGLPGGTLPPLPPTPTAVPHTTPTAVPAPDVDAPPAVDWSDVSLFRQAMRPEFAGDVDAFADRNRYVIDATVTLTDVAAIYGAERVRYTNRSADTLTEVVFRLYPNLDAYSGQMNITAVTVDGQPVTPEYQDRRSVLVVPLPEALEPGQSVELTVGFNSAIEKGFSANYGEYSFQQGIFSAPQWYPALSVYEEGHGWWTERSPLQGDPSFMETGLYEVRMTADEDLTIVLSGTEIEAVDNGDGTITHHVVSGPMRDSILIASRELRSVSGEKDGIAVNVYYWNDEDAVRNERAAGAGLNYTLDAVEIFNRRFGQYPFAEFDVVQTDTDAGGIEYPGVIVIANNYWDTGAGYFEVVLAHETAHQWWYSLVGNNQVEQPFVDEGLTSFCEYVYFWDTAHTAREIEDAEDYVRGDQAWFNTYVGQGNPNLPLGLPVASYVDREYVMTIYTKGPLFFNEITETIGREQLYAVLQEYFRRYRYEVANIGDMLAVFEDVTGQSWDAFFYEWIGSFPGLDASIIPTVEALHGAVAPPTALPTAAPLAQGGVTPVDLYGPAMRPDFLGDLQTESAGRPMVEMDVTLTVNEDTAQFDGVETVHVTNTSADEWNRVVFRLYPNLRSYGGELTISDVTVGGQPVEEVILDESQTVFDVILPAALPPGGAVDVTLTFQTTVAAGVEALYNQFSYLDGVLAAPNFFPLLSVYEADEGGWWRETAHPQGDAVYSETAFFHVGLTAPAGWVVATSGVTLDRQDNGDTVSYAIAAPLARDFALMASEDFEVISGMVGDVKVNVVSTDEGLASRASYAALDLTSEAVRVFEEAFGAYPFAELDVVETPTSAGGIEYPGLIVIARSLWNPSETHFTTVVVHETAHQWWYSLVGNDQMGDPWIDESLTQYAVAVYFREAQGDSAGEAALAAFQGVYEPLAGTAADHPIGLSVADYDDAYIDIVYYKGPLFFDLLADTLGYDALLDALRDYFAAYRYEVAEPADVLASFEASFGRDDLDAIFREWVGE